MFEKHKRHTRNLFATSRDSEELKDPHLMLLNVFEQPSSFFEFTEGDDLEVCCLLFELILKKKIPRIFPLQTKGIGAAIVDRPQFQE